MGPQLAFAEDTYRPETMVHMQAGIKLLRDHQLAKARQEFEVVVKMEPNVPDAYNNLGLAYSYENNNAKAQQYYRKALDLEPLYAPALNNLGLILYNMGKPDEALHYWQRCLQVSNSKEPDLYYYIANALKDTGKKAEARENYLMALKLKPDNASAFSGLAALDLGEGRLDDALSEVKKSLKLKPDSAFSYYHLGLIEEKRGNAAGALAAYQNSLKYETVAKYSKETRDRIARLRDAVADPAGAASDEIKARAMEALKKEHWDEARKDLEGLAHGTSATDPIVWNNLGLALAGAAQNDLAVQAYRKALQIRKEGFAEAQYNLGMVLLHMGDSLGAQQAFTEAIADSAKLKKTNPLAQNMVGIICRERGEFDAADRAFKLAIIQSGDSLPVAHYNRAILLEHNENSREAKNEYETYLKHSPNGKNAVSARKRLKRLIGA
jgi:superkiller protein 3